MRRRNRRLIAALVILAGIAVVGVIIAAALRSDDNRQQNVQAQAVGGLSLDRAEVTQSGQTHIVPAGLLRGQVQDLVLEPGGAALRLTFKRDDGAPAVSETVILIDSDDGYRQSLTTDAQGQVEFLLNLTLDGVRWRWNPYQLQVGGDEREFKLLAMEPVTTGGVTGGDMVNTPSEMGVTASVDQPRTVEFQVDPIFLDAFSRFCGFAPEDVKAVHLEPNDRPRFQVAWTGADFVQSQGVIAVGQPVWAAISTGGDRCYINPPCGNPEVPEGKLPPVPPSLQPPPAPVPTPTKIPPTSPPSVKPTKTPRPGTTTAPTNTPRPGETPQPATKTPVPTKTLVRATSTFTPKPTNTPKPPRPTSTRLSTSTPPRPQTPAPTPTGVVCPCPTPSTPENTQNLPVTNTPVRPGNPTPTHPPDTAPTSTPINVPPRPTSTPVP